METLKTRDGDSVSPPIGGHVQVAYSFLKQKLDKPEKNLYGPSRTPLQVIGQFTAKTLKGRKHYNVSSICSSG